MSRYTASGASRRRGQLHLEPDAVGLVGAGEDAAALVAEGNGRRRRRTGCAASPRSAAGTQRLVDAGEQELVIPSPVSADTATPKALDEARQRGVGVEPVRLVQDDDGRTLGELESPRSRSTAAI